MSAQKVSQASAGSVVLTPPSPLSRKEQWVFSEFVGTTLEWAQDLDPSSPLRGWLLDIADMALARRVRSGRELRAWARRLRNES